MTGEKDTKKDDPARLLNTGITIQTSTFGEIIVKELTLEQTIQSIAELSDLLKTIDFGKKDSGAMFRAILEDSATLRAMRVLASAVCNRTEKEFKDIPLSDWMKILKAFIEVNDLEELKELFIQTGIGNYLTKKRDQQ